MKLGIIIPHRVNVMLQVMLGLDRQAEICMQQFAAQFSQATLLLCRFGQSRKEAESFVNSFEDVSVTQRLRIMGDDVRLFRYVSHTATAAHEIPLCLHV